MVLERVLKAAQMTALALIVLLVANTRRWTIFMIDQPNVFDGFRAAFLYLFDIPLVVLVIILGIRFASQRRFRQEVEQITNDIVSVRWGGLWWLLVIVWSSIGALWADEPSLARFGAVHTMLLFLMALALAESVRRGADRVILLALGGGAVFQALLAIAQVAHQDALGLGGLGEVRWASDNLYGFAETTFRGYGLTAHPNMLAGYLLAGLFAGLVGIVRGQGWQRIAAGTAAVITAVGLLVTLSRTGLIAAGIAGVVLVLRSGALRGGALRRLPPKLI
jgi:hypothetical protein